MLLNSPQFQALAGTIIGRHDNAVMRASGIRYARAERFGWPVPEPSATVPIQATRTRPRLPPGN